MLGFEYRRALPAHSTSAYVIRLLISPHAIVTFYSTVRRVRKLNITFFNGIEETHFWYMIIWKDDWIGDVSSFTRTCPNRTSNVEIDTDRVESRAFKFKLQAREAHGAHLVLWKIMTRYTSTLRCHVLGKFTFVEAPCLTANVSTRPSICLLSKFSTKPISQINAWNGVRQ